MEILGRIIGILCFLLLTAYTFRRAFGAYKSLYRNIMLGKSYQATGAPNLRLRNVLLIALGQQKMFKNPLVALLHLFIYTAFVITQLELLEIMLDGLFGTHHLLRPLLGGFHTFTISLIEILSVLALIATVAFLSRRNLLKLPRFTKPELLGWPTKDANQILIGEILLVTGIFLMNGAGDALHFNTMGHGYDFAISRHLYPLFGNLSNTTLHILESIGWWLHLIVVYAFILYLPTSKHLHILLSFPNVYFSKLTPKGKMDNMPSIMNEVKSMMGLAEETPAPESANGEIPKFGASDVFDLTWKNLLDAYSCTECGRCTASCPANITGKKLSPRKIMMDVRDRLEEVGKNLDTNNTNCIKDTLKNTETQLTPQNYADGKSLFDYITTEELHACTTCNACVEACPVTINPLDIILQLRRHEILDLASGPQEWVPMFTSLENSGSVWQLSDDRDKWTKDL